MENINRIISDLAELRKLPQFFYCGGINRLNLLKFRKELRKYIESGGTSKEVDFILNSPGGDPDAAYKIISILKNRFEKVNVVVPLWAKSAATLLSLGADELIMDEMGELGPLDPQIRKEKNDSPDFDYETSLIDESALQLIEEKAQFQFLTMFMNIHENKKFRIDRKELSRQIFHYLSEFYTPLLSQIDPYKMGQKNRITRIASEYAKKIMKRSKNPHADADTLIYYLANECPVHGFVVDYHQLKEFGFNVKLSDEIGTEYEEKLRELSDYLSFEFDHNTESIAFIPALKLPKGSPEIGAEQQVNHVNGNENGKQETVAQNDQ